MEQSPQAGASLGARHHRESIPLGLHLRTYRLATANVSDEGSISPISKSTPEMEIVRAGKDFLNIKRCIDYPPPPKESERFLFAKSMPTIFLRVLATEVTPSRSGEEYRESISALVPLALALASVCPSPGSEDVFC